VALSSIASYRGLPPLAGYCASKAGVRALCEAFRVELAPLGIRVTTLCPGFIKTAIAAHIDFPEPPPMLTVEDAVRCMLSAIGRGRAFYVFPGRDAWRVRLLRYLPRCLSDWMVGRGLARLRQSRARSSHVPIAKSSGVKPLSP
jgi:hypothetical protein